MLAREGEGMATGLHSALIQDSSMTQGKAENAAYDHGHTAFQRKPERGGLFEHVPHWQRGAAGANDPLFPEPETAVPKAFNGGAARWGANDGEAKKHWAGGRNRAELEPRRPIGAQVPALNGTRRWEDGRPQERNNSWNGESRQPARDPDSTWRAGGVPTRYAQPKNDMNWRKAGDAPAPAARPNGAAGQGVAAPAFAAARPAGARPQAGVRPAPFQARLPGGVKKYRKEELLNVLTTMKQQVGDQLPLPEGSNLVDDVKELWRAAPALRPWNPAPNTDAAPRVPPGLDHATQKLQAVLPQISNLGIPSPLQVLRKGEYLYKDPSGVVQGPFTAENLKSWNDQGYLYPELECTSSALSQTFFPFSALSALWDAQDKLGLNADIILRLIDAEERMAKQLAAPPVPAVPQPEIVAEPAPFTGAQLMDAVAGQQQAPVVDTLAPTDGGWNAPEPEQPPVHRAVHHAQRRHQPSNATSSDHSAHYDPIDDIIDEGPRTAAPVPGRERTLQPFMGMGSQPDAPAAAPEATNVLHQYASAAPDIGSHSMQAAEQAVPDAMQNLYISQVHAPAAPVIRTKVDPTALFGGQQPAQGAAQGAVGRVGAGNEAVNAQRIAPAQLFAQFTNAHDAQGAANGHALPDATLQQALVQPPAPPPRAAAQQQQQAAASRPMWGAAQPVRPAKFDEIQAEEIQRRKQENAAAQVAAKSQVAQAEAERARRAAWMTQPKPVNFRQIVEDDEECAADLEGGCFEGKDDYADQAMGYNPWQGQAALPADGHTHAAAAPMGADVYREPAVDPAAPAAPYARTAAQVLGKDARAAATQPAPMRTHAAKQAWQASAARPTEQAAPPPPPTATEVLQEPEPEILKNNPEFYEWCMREMKRLQGDINILVVLLETGANCEIMDFARSNLKGDNIGSFVSEFIKRKAQAATAKPTGRKRKGKGAAAVTNAVAPQAAPPRGGGQPVAETTGDGWEAVGAKGKPKRKGGAAGAAQPAGQNVRAGGGAFAVLPSL